MLPRKKKYSRMPLEAFSGISDTKIRALFMGFFGIYFQYVGLGIIGRNIGQASHNKGSGFLTFRAEPL